MKVRSHDRTLPSFLGLASYNVFLQAWSFAARTWSSTMLYIIVFQCSFLQYGSRSGIFPAPFAVTPKKSKPAEKKVMYRSKSVGSYDFIFQEFTISNDSLVFLYLYKILLQKKVHQIKSFFCRQFYKAFRCIKIKIYRCQTWLKTMMNFSMRDFYPRNRVFLRG